MNRTKAVGFIGAAAILGGGIALLGGSSGGPCPLCWLGGGAVQSASDQDKAGSSITIPVQGMTCSSCTPAVRVAVKKRAGVIDAHVSLKPDPAVVTCDPGQAHS